MMLALAGCHGVRVQVVPSAQPAPAGLHAPQRAQAPFQEEKRQADVRAASPAAQRDGWFIELGAQQYHPRLNPSESLIDRRLTGPNKIMFPNQYRNVETFDDLADSGKLWLATVGVGKRVESWLTLSGHFMFGSKRISNDRWLGGIFTLDADFEASLYALSFKASILPFGQPARSHDGSLRAVLLGARPAIEQGIEVEYLNAKGVGEFKGLGIRLDRVKRTYRDWNVSYNPGISWEFPLNEASSVVVGGNYNFHVYQPEELDGWNLTLALRYELR